MKKIVSIALLICIATALLCFDVTAEDTTGVFNYTVDGFEYTVTFEGGDISPAKMQLIAEETIGLRTGGLSLLAADGCEIHSLTTSTSRVIQHKAYENEPRCLRKKYEIVSCTKCEFYVKTLINKEPFYCCPKDLNI